jgi:hypothetical protein
VERGFHRALGWRHRDRQMVVLGFVAFPINARAELLEPASATQAPSPDCIIKGNINRHGERIYFRPGQLDYVQVNMTKQAMVLFRARSSAAGWRPAAR